MFIKYIKTDRQQDMIQGSKQRVIHTRREVISIFEQLKTRINIAYESLTEQSFENLLTVIRVIYYLHPMPRFLIEINAVGTIPVSVFLQNLLIKTNMTKLAITKQFRNWIISLLLQFKQAIPSLKIDDIKEIRNKKYTLYQGWDEPTITAFVVNDVQTAVKRRDIGLLGVLVHFLRVYFLYAEYHKVVLAKKQDQRWHQLLNFLVEGTKILENLAKEEISICIVYFLCLKQKALCETAISSGVIQYLLLTLNSQYISSSFGKKVIQFLKYLLLHLDTGTASQINISSLQKSLAAFSTRFDKDEVIGSIRDLLNIFEQKVSVMDYEQRIQNVNSKYEKYLQSKTNEGEFVEALNILNLYLHNDRMGSLIDKYCHSLFFKILDEQNEPQMIKMVIGLLAYNFKRGKLKPQVAVTIVTKTQQIIGDVSLREYLIENRKRLLIAFIRSTKRVVQNREHYPQTFLLIQNSHLQAKFWHYSDCTTFIYEQQLLQLHRILGGIASKEFTSKQIQILKNLEADIINKARYGAGKVSWDLYEEVRFLENELDDKGKMGDYEPSHEVLVAVSNYIQTVNHKAVCGLLQNIDNQEGEHLRKEFNLVCCRLITKLLKNKPQKANNDVSVEMAQIKNKMIALTASKDEIDDIYDMINNFFMNEETVQEEHERRKSVIRESMMMEQQLHLQLQFTQKIRRILHDYFRQDTHFDLTLVKINNPDDLSIIMQELSQYETEADIVKYLKVILELAHKESFCGLLYSSLGSKLFQIYQALIGRQEGNDEEVVALIEAIEFKFVRFHLRCLFNDIYDADSVSYYMGFVGQIDDHFEFGFTQKRIEFLQTTMEFLECNMIESSKDYEKLLKKEERPQFIKSFIDNGNPEAIGLSYARLLSLNSDDELHQDFWMQHKQNILRGLNENNDNTNLLKFLQIYLAECERFIYKEYQLQTLLEVCVQLFDKECSGAEQIYAATQGNSIYGGVLKLRKIKYFAAVLCSLGEREDLKCNKNLLYGQEAAIVKALLVLLQCSQNIPPESFKKFYIQQILISLIKTLARLYRLNFIDKDIRSEHLSQHFSKFMEISNEEAINAVCELMRAFLLKKFVSMADCSALQSCESYIDSLPDAGQQHIRACIRIEGLLGVEESLDEQIKVYFASIHSEQQDGDEAFQQFAQSMMRNSKEMEAITEPYQTVQMEKKQSDPTDPIKIIKKQLEKEDNSKLSEALQKLEKAWTQQELFEYLKKILKSPEVYSIKQVIPKLTYIDNIEYYYLLADFFLNCQTLYNKDTSKADVSVQEVYQALIEHIPEICPLDNKYYEILSKNAIGSDICQKKKGGLKAIEIMSKKIIEASTDKEAASRYLYNISKNVGSSSQLKYLNNIKIYQSINGKITSFGQNEIHLTRVCDFITVAAQNASLRSHFQVAYPLSQLLVQRQNFHEQTQLKIVLALNALTEDCYKHKQITQKTNIIPFLVKIARTRKEHPQLYLPCCKLLANIIDYSETLVSQLYNSLALEALIISLLQEQIEKNQYTSIVNSGLKILDFLSRSPESSRKIIQVRFSSLLVPLTKLIINGNQLEGIGYQISLVNHLLQKTDKNMQKTIQELQPQNLTKFLVEVAPLISKIKKSELLLELLNRICSVAEMIGLLMGPSKEILRILVDILKQNEHELLVIEKWTKIICSLFQSNKQLYFADILKSNLFYLAATCLKANSFLSELTMSLNIKMMKQFNEIQDPDNLLIRHGFASYMIQVLKMKNIQTNDYVALLGMLKKLQEKSVFPPHLSTKLFEIVIKKLEHHWNDQLAVRSILLLKKIKKNVEITNEFSHNLFEFFNKFLIQCGKSSGNYEFYSISRQVICLISYYINFNEDIKQLFRSQAVVNLLKQWLKAFKSSAEIESQQTYRLWLYSAFGNQTLMYDVCGVSNQQLSQIEARFEKGWKCNLFRIDGSCKTAVFRYDKKNQQIVAFKHPDGQIKTKYRLPLKTILLMYIYVSSNDFLWKESRLTRTINPFQHESVYKNSITIFSLIEERFQVRQISLEMESQADLKEVYYGLKTILNKIFEKQKEEEVKIWIAKSSRDIPIQHFGP